MGNTPLNTLDEPIWETIKRDLHRIGGNLILVVFPFKNRDQQSAALRNWDLWGPMVSIRLLFLRSLKVMPQPFVPRGIGSVLQAMKCIYGLTGLALMLLKGM